MMMYARRLPTHGAAPAVILVVAAFFGAHLFAGTQDPPKSAKAPAFEVASVKRSPPLGAGGAIMVRMGGLQGNRWTADGVTLFMLIRQAYAPKYQMQGQVVGGPSWLQSDRFIINAKAEGMPTQEEARLMVQQLLADRFKLVVRQEMRELPVYALVLARSDGRLGPDLKPLTVDCTAVREKQKEAGAQQAFPVNPGDAPPPCLSMMMMSPTSMRLQSGGGTIAELTAFLSQAAGRPVVDRTGLTGYYSANVEFAREPGAGGLFGGAPPVALPPPDAAGGNTTPSDVPSIFAAVQERLGLKLEPRRENAEVLVIERAEPPVED